MGVIARQSIKGSLANYLGVAIGFVTTFFVLTDCLTQEQIGLTRVMVDAGILFSSLAQLGSSATILRFFPYFRTTDGDDSHHGIFGWALLLPFFGYLLVVLLFLLFGDNIKGVYAERSPMVVDYFYLLLPLIFVGLYQTMFETCASVLMRITVPKMVREVGIRLMTLTCYLLYGHGVVSFDLFMYLFCGAYAVAMLLNLAYLLSLGKISFKIEWKFLDAKRTREMIGYTLFMTVTILSSYAPTFNTLFLGAKTGLAMTGVYAIAMYISNIVDIPYRSLGAISRPVIARSVKEDDWNEVNHMGQQVSVHQFMVSSLLLFFISINLTPLYAVIPHGAEYVGGISVVLIMGIAKVVNSSLAISCDVLNFSRYYRHSLPLMVLLAASSLLCNYWLVPLWGINGAACATLISYVLYYLLLMSLIGWRLKVSLLCRGHLKVLALVAVLVGTHLLWNVIVVLHAHSIVWTLLAAALQTAVMALLTLILLRWLNISDSVNDIIDRYILRPLHLGKKM